MYAEPQDFDRGALTDALSVHWGIAVSSIHYEPVGFGTHHYVVTTDDGVRWFVNVDDLATKSFDALDRALQTATALRRAGLEFVHAPTPCTDGRVLAPLGEFAVSVFGYIDGTSADFGEYTSARERRLVLRALGRMHAAGDHLPRDLPRRDTLEVPARPELFVALADLDSAWTGGPFSERAREALVDRVQDVRRLFEHYDDLVAAVAAGRDGWVVTHGEPHAANIIRLEGDDFVLIDWDTAAIGPRERDLWMVEPRDDDDWDAYTSSGGSAETDPRAFELYRTWWTLCEVSLYTEVLRSPHIDDANTRLSLQGLIDELAKTTG